VYRRIPSRIVRFDRSTPPVPPELGLERLARRAKTAAITAWVLWPLSYAWIPLAGRNPAWLLLVVPLAEIGAVAFASAAVWGGIRARRQGTTSRDAQWAIGLGVLGLLIVIGGNLFAVALIR
jgi:hypothetical protein